jgi:hypothetical protein
MVLKQEKDHNTMHQNEFSRMVDIKKLNSSPKEYVLSPSQEELKSLAQRFEFLSLPCVESTLLVHKIGSKVFVAGFAKGEFQKDSFSAVENFYEDIKVLIFTDKTARDFDSSRLENNTTDPWYCDVIEEEEIDIGEIVSQSISLSTMELKIGSQERVIELF